MLPNLCDVVTDKNKRFGMLYGQKFNPEQLPSYQGFMPGWTQQQLLKPWLVAVPAGVRNRKLWLNRQRRKFREYTIAQKMLVRLDCVDDAKMWKKEEVINKTILHGWPGRFRAFPVILEAGKF